MEEMDVGEKKSMLELKLLGEKFETKILKKTSFMDLFETFSLKVFVSTINASYRLYLLDIKIKTRFSPKPRHVFALVLKVSFCPGKIGKIH